MSVAKEQLTSIIERIESLEVDKGKVAADIKGVYDEAKSNGYDTKILRAVIGLRKLDEAERNEQAALIDVYMTALGMTEGVDEEDEA